MIVTAKLYVPDAKEVEPSLIESFVKKEFAIGIGEHILKHIEITNADFDGLPMKQVQFAFLSVEDFLKVRDFVSSVKTHDGREKEIMEILNQAPE